jgi:hypothetical protein
MSAAAGGLLVRLEELLAAVPASPIDEELRRAVRAHEARAAVLRAENEKRKAAPAVQPAVRRAADRCLVPALRARLPREEWPGYLLGWLKARYGLFDLARLPDVRTVHAALEGWAPSEPYGDAAARGEDACHNPRRSTA